MTLRGGNKQCTCIDLTWSHCEYILDSGLLGASRELSVNEDTHGKANFALEGFIVELVSKGSCRHRSGVGVLWWAMAKECQLYRWWRTAWLDFDTHTSFQLHQLHHGATSEYSMKIEHHTCYASGSFSFSFTFVSCTFTSSFSRLRCSEAPWTCQLTPRIPILLFPWPWLIPRTATSSISLALTRSDSFLVPVLVGLVLSHGSCPPVYKHGLIA